MNTETTPAPLEIVTDSPAELVAVIKESGLEPVSAQSLLLAFKPAFLAATKLIDDAKAVVVTDATMVTEIKRARALRLDLKKVRVDAEKLKDKLRENSKREANAILGVWNLVKLHIEPVEQRLQEAEDFAVRAEAERKEKLKTERVALIKPFADPTFYQLGDMPQDAFEKLIDGLKAAALAAQQAKEKAEADRLAKEQAEAAERERIRLENEKLKQEAEERERQRLAEQARAEAAAELARKEKEAAEELLAKERAAAAEALRVAEENARLAREAAEKEAKRLKDEAEAKLAEERRQAEVAAAKLKAEAEAKLAEERRLAQVEADRLKEVARLAELKARTDAIKAKAIADEAQRVADAKAAADMAKVVADAKAAQDAREADEKAERLKRQLEQVALENQMKEERLAREKLEAEAQARESARLAAIEAERVAAAKAASAPDRDKLISYANAIRALDVPEFSTDAAKALSSVIASQREKFAKWLEEKAGGL